MTAAPFRLPTLPGDGVCLQPLGEHDGDGDLYAALYGCADAMRWIGEPLGRGEDAHPSVDGVRAAKVGCGHPSIPRARQSSLPAAS